MAVAVQQAWAGLELRVQGCELAKRHYKDAAEAQVRDQERQQQHGVLAERILKVLETDWAARELGEDSCVDCDLDPHS